MKTVNKNTLRSFNEELNTAIALQKVTCLQLRTIE